MAFIIPSINLRGLWKLKAPFDVALHQNAAYECKSVRTVTDITGSGHDPFVLYYTPYQIDKATYDADLKADPNLSIVGLQSSSGHWVYVPTSYIAELPDTGGIPYTPIILGCYLGPVHDGLDLSAVITAVENTIQDSIGLIADVRKVAAGHTANLTAAEHQAIETARKDRIQNEYTDAGKAAMLQAENDQLRQKVAQLEAYILAHP